MREFTVSTPTATLVMTPASVSTSHDGGFGVRMTFARDEEIFAQEEEADLIYKVVSGAVRTTCLMADGRRQIGSFYFAGDVFGVEAGEFHRFSAEALCDLVVLVMKRSLVERDEALRTEVWRATAQELARAQEHLLLLGRKTACEKVASFIIDLARRQGGEKVFLPMCRQDMADYLGLTIETVSRMMTQLQAERAIALDDARRVRIQGPALERMASA